MEFQHNDTVFSVKRLLPADLKELYIGPGGNMDCVEGEDNPFPGKMMVPHQKKGGGQAHKEYHLRLPDGGQGHGHHAVDLPRL